MATRRIRLVLVVVSLVVLQTTVFTHLKVFGVVPDLALVAAIAVAYEEGPMSGARFGFGAGLATDVFLSSPFGLSALAFALTGYGVGLFQSGLIRESRGMASALGGVGGLIGNTLFIIVGAIVGRTDLFAAHNIQVVIIAALYDALAAVVVFPFVRWAVREADAGTGWPRR